MVQQPITIEQCKKILTRYWGFTSFKPLQEEIIRSVAEGRDTLGLMPTGGGKSITFQVPALDGGNMSCYYTPYCIDERAGKPA
jgi:ATP-dependent DNA helicase RecQ